ncbi:hypothetical protein [Marinomonas balearica]|uniref:hypothetical protein n=1 Tax=Marinomonas balearica TaxID=491947 RepID=UPI00105BF12A|nr:hypothetical protein [Marinomonas balearica]
MTLDSLLVPIWIFAIVGVTAVSAGIFCLFSRSKNQCKLEFGQGEQQGKLLYWSSTKTPIPLKIDQVTWFGVVCSVNDGEIQTDSSERSIKRRLMDTVNAYCLSLKPRKKIVLFRDQMRYTDFRCLCSIAAVQSMNKRYN